MSFYDIYKTDENLEAGSGVRLDYGKSGSIIIHRAGGDNKKYSTVLNAKMRPFRRQLSNGTLDDKTSLKVMAEVYADSVIVGWDKVLGKDGKALPYSRDNVVQLLTDLPELFRDIQEQATTVSNFRKDEDEADSKNSVKS